MNITSRNPVHQTNALINNEISYTSSACVERNSWFICHKPQPKAQLRVICFPWAGGSPSSMVPFFELFPETVEFWALELPGRGGKMCDELQGKVVGIIQRAFDDLLNSDITRSNIPYVIFGHSLGGKIALEVTKKLFNSRTILPKGIIKPKCMIIGGLKSPDLFTQDQPNFMGHLEDNLFLERLKKLGGISETIINSPDVLEFILPILRFDVCLSEDYKYVPLREKLPIPIIALGGMKDQFNPTLMNGWEKLTKAGFRSHFYDGKHFFLLENDIKFKVKHDIVNDLEEMCDIYISLISISHNYDIANTLNEYTSIHEKIPLTLHHIQPSRDSSDSSGYNSKDESPIESFALDIIEPFDNL